MQIMFCTSNLIGAVLIRTVTWSKWSHVAILLGDGTSVEAVYPKVRRVSEQYLKNKYPKYTVVEINIEGVNDEDLVASALSQLEKPYDLKALVGLLIHRDWASDSQWWCSELAAWLWKDNGYSLFRDEAMNRITPQHLWMLNYPIVEEK